MAKARSVYRCTECGAESPKWAGRCESCSAWNTLAEEPVAQAVTSKRTAARAVAGVAAKTLQLGAVTGTETHRWRTGLNEFDFVLGGGIVPGSMVLVGGEPGIGKSTLLLQVTARLEAANHATLYVSGEESALQVKLRADRLTESAEAVSLLTETSLETILATALQPRDDGRRIDCLVVDSIQTVHTELLEGAPGNVGQVRECAARLMRFAKETGTTVFVIGHVTKGGGIAGPKTLEHIVDTVLYFEGDGTLDHRVLRATKNRFGSVDEIGVFRMVPSGLVPVENPSALFVGDRTDVASGSARCVHSWRGRGPSWSRCRRWPRAPVSARRSGWPAASIRVVSRCCLRCSTNVADSRARSWTCSATSWAACVCRSLRSIWPSSRHSRPVSSTSRCRPGPSFSANSDWVGKCARCRRPNDVSQRPRSWA